MDGLGVEDPLGNVQEEVNAGGVLCENCGSETFFTQDGYFFCEVCLTQSQDTQQYVERDEFELGRLNARSVGILRQGKKAKAEKKKSVTTWEAYNCCLKLMTDRLIQIGFPSTLRSKVFQLWTAYLVKRQAIFVSSQSLESDFRVSVAKAQCSIPQCSCNKPKSRRKPPPRRKPKVEMNPDLVSVSEGKRKRSMAQRKAIEKEYSTLGLTDEETSTGLADERTRTSEVKIGSKRLCKFTPQSAAVLKSMKEHRLGSSTVAQTVLNPEMFNVQSLITLLFIALRQIGCSVLLTDVIRLRWDGTLHMSSIRIVLGSESANIKAWIDSIFANQWLDFVTYDRCCESVVNLVNYLGMTEFRYPKFNEFVPKLIDEFTLPREMECLIYQMEKVISVNCDEFLESQPRWTRYKVLPEFQILGVMTVVLKMLFGMDDITEKYQSLFARTVNEVMGKAATQQNIEIESTSEWSKLFVMEDWFKYLRYRAKIVDAELFSPNFYTTSIQPSKTRVTNMINTFGGQKGDNFAREKEELQRKSTEEMFSNYARDPTSDSIPQIVPSYIAVSLPQEDIVHQYKANYPLVNNSNFRVEHLAHCFTKTRIDYVYNPGRYVKLLESAGYTVKIVKGDARNYKKLGNLKDSTIVLFQPFKLLDDHLAHEANCSASLKFVFNLFSKTMSGRTESEKVNEELDQLVNYILYFYSRSLKTGLVQVFPYDVSDSDVD